jgi:hypothetical protein
VLPQQSTIHNLHVLSPIDSFTFPTYLSANKTAITANGNININFTVPYSDSDLAIVFTTYSGVTISTTAVNLPIGPYTGNVKLQLNNADLEVEPTHLSSATIRIGFVNPNTPSTPVDVSEAIVTSNDFNYSITTSVPVTEAPDQTEILSLLQQKNDYDMTTNLS